MSLADDDTIGQRRANLLKGMRAYMKEEDVAYDESDVEACDKIIGAYLESMVASHDRDGALAVVKETVLALNALNEKCDFDLIETDQREDICLVIIRASELRGFNAEGEDITEEWREW